MQNRVYDDDESDEETEDVPVDPTLGRETECDCDVVGGMEVDRSRTAKYHHFL